MEDILVLKSYWGEVCIHIQLSDINSKSFMSKENGNQRGEGDVEVERN